MFPGLLQVLIWNSTDMPWLDTGIESGKVIVDRYALAGYRNRIFKLFRRALARYRNRVWKCGQQICPGWIQESNLELRHLIVIIFGLTFFLKRQNISCMQCHDVWNAWCHDVLKNKWDCMMCICMYHDDAMFMNVFSSRKINPWRVPGSRILGWCGRIAFASAGEDSCKYTGRRR